MTYEIWDGSAPIDGRTSEYIYERHPAWEHESVYIIRHDSGALFDIIALSLIPNPGGLTDPDEIVSAYIESLEKPTEPEPEPEPAGDVVTWDELAAAYTEGVNSIDE